MKGKLGDKVRLQHIAYAISLVQEFMQDKDFAELFHNQLLLSAVERQVEIIGEAANHLSEEIKEKYTTIPWRKIIGFRNLISHEYFRVDVAILWDVITGKLPPLEIIVEEMLADLDVE